MAKNNRKMYNEEQKLEYIDNDVKNSKNLRQYFERISGVEEMYQKDLADMNVEEIKTTLISLNINSIASRQHILYMLRDYIDWCIFNGKTNNENKLDFIKPWDISSKQATLTQMLKSPEQVNEILEKAFLSGYFEQENRKIRDSLFFLLLYAGMTVEEIANLKKGDIDYNKHIVYSGNIKYTVDDNICSLWEACTKMTEIEKSGARQNKSIFIYKLVDNDYLFRPIEGKKAANVKISINNLSLIINKIFKMYFKETGKYILVSPLNVRLSGIFYRILKEHGEVTSELMCKYLNINYDNNREMHMKSRRYCKDYMNWKEVFDYN